MEITQYKAINKGALVATFSVKFKTEYGNLISRKMSHFKKENQEWISWGSEQYEKEGQKKYFQYCMFEEYSEGKIFQHDAIVALHDYLEANPTENIPAAAKNHQTIGPIEVVTAPKEEPQPAFLF